MAERTPSSKPGITADWLVRGALAKLGDMFDRLTGRGWKPSSSLATSELIERLKALLDAEAQPDETGCLFVPNKIKLKMQWDKFTTDSDDAVRKLENELLASAIDHINDRRYYTHAALVLEVKPDYFTSGVRLQVSFEKIADSEREAAVDLAVPGAPAAEQTSDTVTAWKNEWTFEATFTLNGNQLSKALVLPEGKRISVGRTRQSDLVLDDSSVSKIHASLAVDRDGQLIVADTGSTNGTFLDSQRIAYGKAVHVPHQGTVRFGGVDVTFKAENIARPAGSVETESAATEAFRPAEFEFTTRMEMLNPIGQRSASADISPTKPSLEINDTAPTEPSIEVTEVEEKKDSLRDLDG